MIEKLIKTILIFCVGSYLNASSLDRLYILTDHWPPYNIATKGKLSGISVELFELMLKKNNSKLRRKDFKITSWKATYDTAKALKNGVALTTTRNKIRENLFKWVGPIDIKTSGLISKKSRNIRINSMKDLKKYKIAVVKDYSTHQILRKAGLKNNLHVTGGLFAVHKAIDNLSQNRVDIYSTSNVNYIMKILHKKNFNVNDYEVVKKYPSDKLYFAFNKKTDDKIIKEMQNALDELKSDGTYQRIKAKYLY